MIFTRQVPGGLLLLRDLQRGDLRPHQPARGQGQARRRAADQGAPGARKTGIPDFSSRKPT